MRSDENEAHIYAADLRNRAIPCGDCDFEEWDMTGEIDDLKRDVRRLDTELDGHEQENARTITQLSEAMRHYSELMTTQQEVLSRMDARLQDLEVKLDRYNHLRERTDQLEESERRRSSEYVPRQEFNGALNALRHQISTLQWIFGLGFTATAGLLTGVVIFLLRSGVG